MEIRKLTDENAVEHEKLASQAFVFPFDEAEALPLPSGLMLGAFLDDGRLAADMEIYDRVCFFGENTLSCAAVGGVASKPEHRRHGAVRSLFSELVRGDVLEKKWDVSLLYPFSDAFYKKLGYAPVGAKLRVKVPFSEFSHIPANNAVRLFEGEKPEALLRIYNEAAAYYRLNFRRDDLLEWNKEPYSQGIYTYIWHNAAGDEKAFATFSLHRENGTVSVKETAFADKEALLGIIGFLRCLEGNFPDIVFECLPGDTPVPDYIADAHRADITLSYAGAVKILDMESVLKKHPYPERAGSFTVEITGEGVFFAEYANGWATVKRTERKADVVLSPVAAAKIFTEGLRDERELLFLPGVTVNGSSDDFLRAFPFQSVFFSDSF